MSDKETNHTGETITLMEKTWTGALGLIFLGLEHGTQEGKIIAKQHALKMARVADLGNEAIAAVQKYMLEGHGPIEGTEIEAAFKNILAKAKELKK